MKQLTEKEGYSAPSAWGTSRSTYAQKFEVEASDVGKLKRDYGGENNSDYTFKKSDVGRKIVVYTDRTGGSWTCWHFCASKKRG